MCCEYKLYTKKWLLAGLETERWESPRIIGDEQIHTLTTPGHHPLPSRDCDHRGRGFRSGTCTLATDTAGRNAARPGHDCDVRERDKRRPAALHRTISLPPNTSSLPGNRIHRHRPIADRERSVGSHDRRKDRIGSCYILPNKHPCGAAWITYFRPRRRVHHE